MDILFRILTLENADVPDAAAELLSPRRRESLDRQRTPAGRAACLYGELLLRRTLWELCGGLPAVEYGENEYGKPFLLSHPGLRFSLSHTEGAVAAAVWEGELGVDIERSRPVDIRIARRFSPEEKEYVGAGPGAQERFFELWTKKEAFMKYRGLGFSLPMSGFSVLPGGEGEPRLAFCAEGLYAALCTGGAEALVDIKYIAESRLLSELLK